MSLAPRRIGGPIAWMARNSVAANLLMAVLILGGIYMMLFEVKQEYLPSAEPDTVTVSVALPGATPAEVEQSIVLALEDALTAVQGIDKLTANASEGSASITLELGSDRDQQLVYNDIQQAVDGVTGFPVDAEEPSVRLNVRRRAVIDVLLYGQTTDQAMRMAGEQIRTALLQHKGIAQVDIVDQRELELHIEIPDGVLRAHDLTLSDIATVVRQSALERSGGTLETSGGDLLLRLDDRREDVEEFARIPIVTTQAGAVLRLGDIAEIRRGFANTNTQISFEGKPAIELEVFRVGEQTPITVAAAVREVIPVAMQTLPGEIEVVLQNDRSQYYRGRMDLLTKNGLIGLGLVLLLLTLFLEIRLACWVAIGIPTAFIGAMLVLPSTGASINLVSMFAFILALGIVVDDAIVAGENIYEYRQRGMDKLTAAIQGARDIAVPLSFSILTNIVAFIPLALVPGSFGKFWVVIPIVVSLAFIASWIEALFILPAHLAGNHGPAPRLYGPVRWVAVGLGAVERGVLHPVQRAFAGGLAWFTRAAYGPALRAALNWRYVTVALMGLVLTITMAWVGSGRMGFGLFPPVPRDYSKAVVTMPVGTPMAVTEAARDTIVEAAHRVIEANGGLTLSEGVRAKIDGTRIDVRTFLTEPGIRPMETREFTSAWRKEMGTIPSARSSRFESSWGGPGGTSLQIRLSHTDTDVLAAASARLAADLSQYGPVRDPDDGFSPGKAQLEFRLTEAGRSLGLTSEEVGRQVRAAFFGVEALAQQEGRNEVTIRVRRPVAERSSESDIETLLIRTPDGGTAPLYEIADIERGRADSGIKREDGSRVVSVTANVEPRAETNQVLAAATRDLLPQLQKDFPGIGYSLEGRQATQRDTMRSLYLVSIPLALIIIYGLLAIPFRSYLQPAVIMAAIPFGFVGAVIGHLIMGYSLSIISVFGIIALSGVVINAGIVMMDYANKARAAGKRAFEAIEEAGLRRFRPILLTTVTTFCGLAPMIFETSRQAKFLIPMAISLGYGIVFATLIVLFLIPALYLVLEDLKRLVNPEIDAGPVPAE
ncbi:MAG: efflux RND transporter permease subunit [Paracoccaceae bacterium]